MRLIGVACSYQKPHKLTAPAFLISKLYTYKSVKVVQANWATSVLPSHLLQLHEKAITAFNEFKDVMKQTNYGEDFDSAKQDAFARIIDIKDMLEAGLRDFLRTERLIT